MKTKPILLTLTIFALFSFGSLRNATMADYTVAEALEATTQVASSTSATHDEGVVINGVRWATRNVDAPGTFAPYPESPGMFFQWNRRKGWNATDRYVEGWDNSTPTGTKWYAENDPCPAGWRVPTREELQSLYDSGSAWVIFNEIGGLLFGINPNQFFLPATGARSNLDGTISRIGVTGTYWSSSGESNVFGFGLEFNNSEGVMFGFGRAIGLSIRCVAK